MGPNYFHNADISVLKTYDAATVQTAFNSIVKDYQIEFTFQQGGCPATGTDCFYALTKEVQYRTS